MGDEDGSIEAMGDSDGLGHVGLDPNAIGTIGLGRQPEAAQVEQHDPPIGRQRSNHLTPVETGAGIPVDHQGRRTVGRSVDVHAEDIARLGGDPMTSPLPRRNGGLALRCHRATIRCPPMGIRSEWVRSGAAATERLGALVAEAQGGDPLAPGVVLVPTNPVGVAVRRALGSRAGGVANVTFITIDQLAHDIAGPGLEAHGQRPLTDQVRAAAVRLALRSDPRGFAAVAEHPSTDRALADALAQLRRAGAGARTALARVPRALTQDMLAVATDVDARLREFYDDMAKRAAGEKIDRATSVYPSVGDGVEGMLFIQQSVASSAAGGFLTSL